MSDALVVLVSALAILVAVGVEIALMRALWSLANFLDRKQIVTIGGGEWSASRKK